jgi:SAM-dependent methyltransferase
MMVWPIVELQSTPANCAISACRSCGSTLLDIVADLGSTPLANGLLKQEDLSNQELTFPLKIVFCADCSMVQITETVRPDVLFAKYVYASSYSETMLRHAEAVCEELCRNRLLNGNSLVIEIASNDGYLLQFFAARGIPVLGIEPAANIAAIAQRRGVRTRVAFFDSELANQLVSENVAADAIIGNNVLAHVAGINGFIAGVKKILKPGAIARFEFPYLGDMIDNLEFDTIYHEHIFYLSAHAIERLCIRHGLIFTDVEHLPIHGGSLAITASFEPDLEGRKRVHNLLEDEKSRGMNKVDYYTDFGDRIHDTVTELRKLLHGLRSEGKRICAYGASAKGTTLLNMLRLEPGTLDYVVDRSSLKQGLFTPGTHLRILPPERLEQDKPEYVLLLTWNFAAEILEQQRKFREVGGKFIVPIPKLVIV